MKVLLSKVLAVACGIYVLSDNTDYRILPVECEPTKWELCRADDVPFNTYTIDGDRLIEIDERGNFSIEMTDDRGKAANYSCCAIMIATPRVLKC